jgi:competence protein ComEC
MRDLGMARGARELIDRRLVASQAEPVEAIQYRVDRGVGGARAIRILDAEQIGAAVVPREQPVEERRARAANVEIAGRRGRKPCNNRFSFLCCVHSTFLRHFALQQLAGVRPALDSGGPSMASSLLQTDVAAHRIFPARRVISLLEAWAEAERSRIGLWVPVVLGAGIAAWFALNTPEGWVGWIVGCCAAGLGGMLFRAGSRIRAAVLGAGLWMAAGCALIWAKALLIGQPPLERPVYAAFVARVVAVEPQPALGRTRLLLEPEASGVAGLPGRVRLNVMDRDMPPRDGLGAGAVVAVRSRLLPPQPAAVPGGYDFAAQAYFMGIGATGRALPPVRVITPAAPSGMAAMRDRLSRHIRAQLPGGEGAIAATLATGDMGAIGEEDVDAMRNSGLAHLLSISGLHVSALIAGVVLILYRILALSPRVALLRPLMLIASGGGALAGISYTLFTGAQVPTVRSCIAALLVLGGLALGREAISLRLVAVGALVVLLFWPEALMGPSFQMSFMAVTVIVALVDSAWFRAHFSAREEGWPGRMARHLAALFVTGIAVEVALMPIALAHFHQAGVLGALANLVAIPLTTLVIMPTEAAALALDLAGAGAPMWWVAGKALALLLGVAHAVAASPWAVWALPPSGMTPLVLVLLGALWLMLWSSGARFAGVPLIALGVAMALRAPAPDLLVTGDGGHMAVRQPDGSLALLRDGAGDYIRETLGKAAGVKAAGGRTPGGEPAGANAAGAIAVGASPADATAAKPATLGGEDMMGRPLAEARNARCSRDMCSVLLRMRERDWLIVATRSDVRIPWSALTRLCTRADIMVSNRRLPAACIPRWLKLDRARLRQTGGVAVYLEQRRWVSVLTPGDRHPWIPLSVQNPPPQHLPRARPLP